MMKHLRHTVMFMFMLILAASEASAGMPQQRPVRTDVAGRPAASMYRLNLTLRTGKGAATYTLILEERSPGKIRSLTKVPVVQGDQTTYIETGVKCDIQFHETETGQIRVEVEAIVSELEPVVGDTRLAPIREWQSRVEATVNPTAPTVLSTYENAGGDGRFQIEIYAEKLQ